MKHCTTDKCPQILDSSCVFYEGASLIFSGINTNDSVEVVIQKLNLKLESIPVFNSNNYYNKTDINNIIKGYIPLSGTLINYPVIGNIEFSPGYNVKLYSNDSFIMIDNENINVNGKYITISSINNNSLLINNTQVFLNSGTINDRKFINLSQESNYIPLQSNFDGPGLVGVNYYGNNYVDNSFVQKKFVIDTFNNVDLSNYYKKTETYSQTEINGFLSGKQNIIGYTPENVSNKSDSYIASSSTTYASTKALVDGLATKLDKGTYTGNAQDLKNSIDGKLNKPTTTSNTTSYPYVVGEDGNGGSARLPAGDLGKNFFNSDLSNTTARNHTMNAGITVNTLGNPHTLSGLPNKNADIANFRKVRVQNASGLDSVVDSKNLLTDGMTSMTDAEKDAWRLAQSKSNENYSTGQPRVDLISPININNSHNYTQYVSVIGLNLYINTGASVVKLVRVKDENGVSITPEETLVDASAIQTFSTNFQILVLGINFFGKAKGYYKVYITSFTSLTNLTSPEFLVEENFNVSNFNPVSFSVVDKYANSSDYVTSSEIYHISQQQVRKNTLEKSVKSNVLFNFQNGFLYEFNFETYLVGAYTNNSFNCGFSNQDFDITNGYTPQAFLGIGGDYGHIFINSVTNKDHSQPRAQTVVIKCIFFNKDGITTIIHLAPNGVALVSSMVQNYNTGDPIRFYANFYSSDGGHATGIGQNFKIQFPSTYQSF